VASIIDGSMGIVPYLRANLKKAVRSCTKNKKALVFFLRD
jgi:hypothetical protein